MVRLFLACWLCGFALQTTDVLMLVAGDGCTEAIAGSAGDPCPESCPQCICCARIAVFVATGLETMSADATPPLAISAPVDAQPNPPPHRIFHVPKDLLI